MIKFGTIGTSWITHQMIEAALMSGKYDLQGVYSRDLAKAQSIVETYQSGRPYDDLAAMLASPEIEVVYIASPNNLHYNQAMQALEAGKHVIVEKPAFMDFDQVHDIYAFARVKGLYLIEAMRHLHTKNYRVLKELFNRLKADPDQPLMGANLNIGQYSSRYPAYVAAMKGEGDVPNIFNPAYWGGALNDLGVYPFYVVIDLFGIEPDHVEYVADRGPNGVDLAGHFLIEYDEVRIRIYVSKAVHSQLPSEIYFGNQTLTIDNITDIDRVSLHHVTDGQVLEVAFPVEHPLLDQLYVYERILKGQADEEYKRLCTLTVVSLDILSTVERE